MCGIAGYFSPRHPLTADALHTMSRAMSKSIAHRGPDAEGFFHNPEEGLALVHRRLSIVDLTPTGEQPMQSACNRYVLVYNGELYNTEELRQQLNSAATHTWRGTSDTEVLLAAISQWGFERALQASDGMFAIALYDKQQKKIYLARDRLGIKPLYYSWNDKRLWFGSELKAYRAAQTNTPEINKEALVSYFRFAYVPTPHSIYQNVNKLEPGTYLVSDGYAKPAITTYWSMQDVVKSPSPTHEMSDDEAIEDMEARLIKTIKSHMVSDVPLGAFLSGGIDSSLVVALMQKASAAPVKTFTIGFNEQAYDEAHFAKKIAAHLGTHHTELIATPQEALNLIPQLPDIYDEPFADSSQIPTLLVCAMTKQHVTVSLSGDGGDETFAGYTRYGLTDNIWNKLRLLPHPLRQALASTITAIPAARWQMIFDALPSTMRPFAAGDRLHKFASILPLHNRKEIYQRLVSQWTEPAALVENGYELSSKLDDNFIEQITTNPIQHMQYADHLTYLPDDILAKVDRASMHVSLEARVPLIDHHLVEHAWHLPMKYKRRKGLGKWLLREVLARHVPKELFERPKMGFGVPIEKWLRTDLRPWAEDLLDSKNLEQAGLMAAPIRQYWQAHQSGQRNFHYPLWTVLMYMAWHKRWMKA